MAIVPTALIADYEAGSMTLRPSDIEAIRAQLEGSGIELIEEVAKLGRARK
jgi:hypothetical protein